MVVYCARSLSAIRVVRRGGDGRGGCGVTAFRGAGGEDRGVRCKGAMGRGGRWWLSGDKRGRWRLVNVSRGGEW